MEKLTNQEISDKMASIAAWANDISAMADDTLNIYGYPEDKIGDIIQINHCLNDCVHELELDRARRGLNH